MKRIVLMVLRNFFRVPWFFMKLCIYGKSEKYSENQRFQLIKRITFYANRGGRIRIESHGMENIPKESGYIMFPNHQGLYDVLAFLDVHPHPFSVVMKKEVENIFFLKQIFTTVKNFQKK